MARARVRRARGAARRSGARLHLFRRCDANGSGRGAVGAIAALVIAVSGRLTMRLLGKALDSTVRITAMFLLMLIGGLFSSFMLTRLGVPQGMSGYLTSLPVPPWVILVLINAMLLALGTVLDPTSVLVIVVPILFKTVVALGYDPVWFGVVVAIQIELAAITPPVGFNLFVLKSVVPDARLSEIVSGASIFVVTLLAAIVLLMIFPQIALFLPGRL